MKDSVLAIHGGAGVIVRERLGADQEQAYRISLRFILTRSYEVLQAGGSSLDAVEQAVKMLEDSELYNAGRGSVLTASGTIEMDASIMNGDARQTGAVGCVTCIKNPVSCARKIMENSSHVFLVGSGAEMFARDHHLEIADASYFLTPFRREQLMQVKSSGKSTEWEDGANLDTVGAVARDMAGHLAAATSTGGTTNKVPGRVGDTPIVGAGIWADDETCAVSCTGTGEYFIRTVFAHEIHSLIRLAGMDLQSACNQALSSLKAMGGDGGCIAVDKYGNVALPMNSAGMYRGWIGTDAIPHVAIFADEQ